MLRKSLASSFQRRFFRRVEPYVDEQVDSFAREQLRPKSAPETGALIGIFSSFYDFQGELSEKDIGRIFPIEKRVHPIIPERFREYKTTKFVKVPVKTLFDSHIVIQKHHIKAFERFDSGLKNLHIEGVPGTGKSVLLDLLVARARDKGYLTMFIPAPRTWSLATFHLETGTGTGVPLLKSKDETEDMFSQPLESVRILQEISDNHKDVLMTLPQKCKYDHELYKRRTKTGVDESLFVIIQRGIRDLGLASSCVRDLRREFSLITEYKTMIAVDEVNTLYWPTDFYINSEHIPPQKLILASTFQCFDKDGEFDKAHELANGIVVTASTSRYTRPFSTKRKQRKKFEKYYPNGMYVPFDYNGNLEKTVKKGGAYTIPCMSMEEAHNFGSFCMNKKYEHTKNVLDSVDQHTVDLEYYFPEPTRRNISEGEMRSNLSFIQGYTKGIPKLLKKEIMKL